MFEWLRIHITFSIALLFVSYTYYIYLKRRINFLSNHDTYKRFWRKKIMEHLYGGLKFKEWKGTTTWSFSYEIYIIRIITFCLLKACLQFLKTNYACSIAKNVLFLLTITLKYIFSLSVTHIFQNTCFSKKSANSFL